jgi:anaerobic magnesium-protoporphyrin IX monomethyl ester cyclase
LKVALVNFIPAPSQKNYLAFNHGLAHLSSVVKKDGHETKLFLISKKREQSVSELSDFQPDVLFVYLTTNQYRLFLFHLQNTLGNLNASVFVGGPHPTCCPEETLQLNGVEGVCIGEGEDGAPEILRRIEKRESFEEIPNIWFKKGEELVQSPIGHFVSDLDGLPFPDREIFPYEHLMGQRAMDILGFEFFFTRGCKHDCTYCINPHLNRLKGKGAHVRMRSAENVVAEIESVISSYGHGGVVGFQDDIFTLDLTWLQEFAEQYRKRIALPFWCNSHVDHLSEKVVHMLRYAGCFRVQIGIECGNETMRDKLLGKRFSNRQVLEVAERLKKHHIKIVTYFMLGLPDESENNILESIALCREIAPDWILVSTFCPYPGTRVYADLVAQGRLDPRFWEREQQGADTYYSPGRTYKQGGVSKETHEHYYRNFIQMATKQG